MPYGFNDDKSKFNIGDIAQIKVIEVTTNNSVAASEGHSDVQINAATLLSNYDIDDISNYAIIATNTIGHDQPTPDTSNWWYDSQGGYGSRAVAFGVTYSNGNLVIHFINDYHVAQYITARIILLRLA